MKGARRVLNRPLVIVFDGENTNLFMDGKVYGDNLHRISFCHDAKTLPKQGAKLEVTADDVNIEGKDDLDTILNFRMKLKSITEK